jgi:hypothetical protein
VKETNIPDYIDNVIASIDERIAEAEAILTFLRKQRATAVEQKGKSLPVVWYYCLPSRSGGAYHECFRDSSGKVTCSCTAAKNGLTCWAKRGILNSTDNTGKPTYHHFYDDKVTRQVFGASRAGHNAARLDLGFQRDM